MPTITEAEVGTIIATDGILARVTMITSPTSYDDDYFSLTDGTSVLFNIHLTTSHIGAGSDLLSNGLVLFKELTVKSIPKGATFEIEYGVPPTLASLNPAMAVSGDPDFVMSCIGTGFTAGSVIRFGDFDEPTTLVSDTEITTGVKPSLFAPAVVPVLVRNGPIYTAPLDFTFTEPVAQ
jgi:hypothetical protein